MPKKFGGVVTLHKANLNLSLLYNNAPVMAAMDIVHQLGRGNCRVVDMRALYYLVAERFRAMRHGEEEKERRARKREKARANQTPVQTERGKRHIAIRKFAERHALPYADARKELDKFWEENAEEEINFDLPHGVTDEQYDEAERLAFEESQPAWQESPVQPRKSQAELAEEMYQDNLRQSAADGQAWAIRELEKM